MAASKLITYQKIYIASRMSITELLMLVSDFEMKCRLKILMECLVKFMECKKEKDRYCSFGVGQLNRK